LPQIQNLEINSEFDDDFLNEYNKFIKNENEENFEKSKDEMVFRLNF
jgi:hypothetical protein